MAEEPEKYTPEAYEEYEIGKYRTRFPDETKALSDEQLFDTVMSAEDDHDDADWKATFLAVSSTVTA